jgi:hypothetical protein
MQLESLHASLSLQLRRLSTWSASASVRRRLPWFAYGSGIAAVLYGAAYGFQLGAGTFYSGSDDPVLTETRWWFLIPAVIAAVSFPRKKYTVTKLWGRIIAALGLVLTTAAVTNSLIDWLRAGQLDDSDIWYLASGVEHWSASSYLWYTLAGAAFVLAVELRERPIDDNRLMPAVRPRPFAWLLAIVGAGAVAFGTFKLLVSLQAAKGQQPELLYTMIVTAALGVIALISPLPVLHRLGKLSVGFAAVIASTAWGLLVGVLYSQRVPDRALSDAAKKSVILTPDQPDSVIDAITSIRNGYVSFIIGLGVGMFCIWWRNKLRRDEEPSNA